MRETVHDSNFIKIEVDHQKKCLIQTWNGYYTSDEFREGQQLSLEHFISHKCINFVCDTTNALPLPDEDMDWVATNITPKLRQAGMTTLNIVVPSNIYTKITLDVYETKDSEKQNNTEIKYFGSIDYALNTL